MERPRFCPSRDFVELAFDQIVSPIDCPLEIKSLALEYFDQAMMAGMSSEDIDGIHEAMGKTVWVWPWFDEWQQKFKSKNRWPFMWRSLNLDAFEPSLPKTTKEAVEGFLLVGQMRKLLKEHGIDSVPRTREDVSKLALKHLSMDSLRPAMQVRLLELQETYHRSFELGRRRLLIHTLTMRTYALSRLSIVDFNRNLKWKIPPMGCPVEEALVKQITKKQKQGLPLTPLFPGDRSRVVIELPY